MPASSCGAAPPFFWLLLSSGKDAQVILTNIYLPKGLGKPNPLFGEEGGGAGTWELLARCGISSPPPVGTERQFPTTQPKEPKMGCGWSRGVPDMGLFPQGGMGCPAEPGCLVGRGRTEPQGSGGRRQGLGFEGPSQAAEHREALCARERAGKGTKEPLWRIWPLSACSSPRQPLCSGVNK